MHWIDKFKLADIHREAYAAILKSWVPHGKREEFARQCGITREYFSCLCVLDGKEDGRLPIHKRYPSPSLAIRIAEALPAPGEIKRSLVENMELAHVNAVETRSPQASLDVEILVERLSELEQTHREATFGKDLTRVQRAYRVVRDASRELLRQIEPEEHPDTAAQACLYYHDAQCVLNRPDEALVYAKTARLILESIDKIEAGYSREQRANLEINAIRGEAIAYHNLGLDRIVPEILLNGACRTSAYRNAKSFWEPIVMRDLINAMVEIPRFSIREVNKTARTIETICENNGDGFTLLLVRESWLRSLIQRGKTKEAQNIFSGEMERLPHLPYVGALHRALLLKSGAHLAWQLHDQESWNTFVTEAISLMLKAGLIHQLSRVRHAFGPALDPIYIERAGQSGDPDGGNGSNKQKS